MFRSHFGAIFYLLDLSASLYLYAIYYLSILSHVAREENGPTLLCGER